VVVGYNSAEEIVAPSEAPVARPERDTGAAKSIDIDRTALLPKNFSSVPPVRARFALRASLKVPDAPVEDCDRSSRLRFPVNNDPDPHPS
jgi:hypothetical protein